MGAGAGLVLLDTTSGSPQAEKAKKLVADGVIPTYTPVEPAPGAGGKRKADDAGAAAAGAGKKGKK